MFRALLLVVTERAWTLNATRDDALATRIINRLGDALKK